MSNIIRLFDRSRTVTDWKCPRSRFLGYETGGRGLAPETGSLALATGIVIHDALAAIATFQRDDGKVDIDMLANLANTEMLRILTPENLMDERQVTFAHEQAALTEGLLRGFYKHVWPLLLAQYPTIVAIEKEVEYHLDPEGQYVFMSKPDLLMEDYNGEIVYIEYKSTSSKKEGWINSWDTAVQLHSSIKAVGQTLGKTPAYVQIVGLYKGYEAYGKQSSPMCYAYMKKGNPPFTTDQIAYEYKAGFKRYPTWELEGGVKKWIDDMPSEILANQFPMTAPIMVNEDLVDAFFKQTLAREKEILAGLDALSHTDDAAQREAIMNNVFPQKFDQCQPGWGWPCDFRKICHGRVDDPLTHGFTLREPHHKREMDQVNETK